MFLNKKSKRWLRMFQNIVDEVEENSSNRGNSIKIKEIFKEIFKYQNVIIYILTFFLSTICFQKNIMTFAISIIAACLSSTIPVIGVLIVSCIGVAVSGGFEALEFYSITFVIYFLLVFLFKPKVAMEERNEILKTGSRLFWASFIVNFFCIDGTNFIYNLFTSAVYSAISYIFYKIFVNGLIVLKSFNMKKVFTVEEVVGSAIIIAIASTALQNVNILGLNISLIIVSFIIMLLGWKHGMLVSCGAGISMGLILAIIGSGNMNILGMLAVAGFLSGIGGRFGRFGSILGFVLGTSLMSYYNYGDILDNINYIELILSAVPLLFIPREPKIQIEDLVGKNKLLTDIGENRLTSNVDIAQKLNFLSNTILGSQLENNEKSEDINLQELYIQNFLDSLENYTDNILYEELSNNEDIIADIYKDIQNNEILIEKNLISIFEKNNNYILWQDETIKNDLQEIIKIANRTQKMLQIDLSKKAERKNQQKILKENMKSVSKVINECAKEITDTEKNKFAKQEQELKILLSKRIDIEDVTIKQAKNKKYIITLKLNFEQANSLREASKIANISDIISKTIGSKMSFQKDYKNVEKSIYTQTYSSEDKYIMQVGTSKISEENSKMSGDCNLQMRINDGKYLLAISDGMGTGKEAREKSKLAIKTLKELLENGFENTQSVELINSMLNRQNETEVYTSMDITVLDLFTGTAKIMKNGACNTYIKNKKNIQVIQSSENPIGILEKVELNETEVQVSDGSMIVMCSDGVLESKENYSKDWIEEFLKNISTNNVQKVADMILAEAIDNSYGIANDDMTVIVAKIIKRK
jgi:stage II sporulation protein E